MNLKYLLILFLITIIFFFLKNDYFEAFQTSNTNNSTNNSTNNYNQIMNLLYKQYMYNDKMSPPPAIKKFAENVAKKRELLNNPSKFQEFSEQRAANLKAPEPTATPNFKRQIGKIKKNLGIINALKNDITITDKLVVVGNKETDFIEYSNINYNLPNWIIGNVHIKDFNDSKLLQRLAILLSFVKDITGNLIIEETILTDLYFLANLRKLTGNLTIKNNRQLINVCGLENLEDFGEESELIIYNNNIKFVTKNILEFTNKKTLQNMDFSFPNEATCTYLETNRLFFKNEPFLNLNTKIIQVTGASDVTFNQEYEHI